MNKRNSMALLFGLILLGSGTADAVLPGEDALIFSYQPSENIALAATGGAVQGKFVVKDHSITLQQSAEGAVLAFKNPGADQLQFPVVGNLAPAEGTLTVRHRYNYDSAAVLSQLKMQKQWSRMFFLFRTAVNSGGVGLFHEVNTSMPSTKIRLTAMISYRPHQWQYEGVTLDRRDFPPDRWLEVGLSWKGKEIALLVNGKIVHRAVLKAVPVWGPMFTIGGTGAHAFSGWLQSLNLYDRAAF